MAQVKYFDKRVGITYVYDSKSYYDEAAHKFKAKRKLIGKIDPETGEIVPTGKIGRPVKEKANDAAQSDDVESTDYKALYERSLQEISQKDNWIEFLEQELEQSKKEAKEAKRTLRKISELCAGSNEE